ncbi:hypothetical protein SAMN05192574_103562 [Mucilaginibacter gossypiicola]|uniref:Uncharacterized protein n=1 Tax=Mucilaginibacter gossypiicola TaxID=551995 RepID=A0A1H8HMH2_9SPHI|nr:hypothetical protein [Mucilaginibacter gossypiicola]SEN57314.1 hypothetical protein SAMN05192574_103562 [Mucilaginibacter gossypiicola]
MDIAALLSVFFKKASTDARISIAHIGLYTSLIQMQLEQGLETPLLAYGKDIMHFARISSSATYHKLIKDLDEHGYVHYEPSYYKGIKSRIFLEGNIT